MFAVVVVVVVVIAAVDAVTSVLNTYAESTSRLCLPNVRVYLSI